MKRFLLISIAMTFFVLMALAATAKAGQTDELIEKAAHRNAAVVRLHKEGRIEEALEAAERAYKVTAETLGLKHAQTATALYNLAALFQEMGELRRAEDFFTRALKIRETVLGARHRDTMDTRRRLSIIKGLLESPAASGEHAGKDKGQVKVIKDRGPIAPGSRSVKIINKPPVKITKNGGGPTAPVKTKAPTVKMAPAKPKTSRTSTISRSRGKVFVKTSKKPAPVPGTVEARVLKTGPPPAVANGGSVKINKKSGAGPMTKMSKGGVAMTGAIGGVAGEMENVEPIEPRSLPMRTEWGEAVPASPAGIEFDEYTVKLEASENMTFPGASGKLIVWIGAPEYTPESRAGMSEAVGSIAAVGETAKVTAEADDFDVEPKGSECVKLDPTGVSVVFTLWPKNDGVFDVGAVVHLYSSDDCSGMPIPKMVETLKVVVEVGTGEIIDEHVGELWEVFWDGFIKFWKAIVALFFGLILFLLRGKLKKIFGFSGGKD